MLITPYIKKLISTNRLLVPCGYFYEWSKSEENKKVPYCFKLKDDNDLNPFTSLKLPITDPSLLILFAC